MNEETIREAIQRHVELIKYDSRAVKEAEQRATSFLVMVAILADEKRNAEEDKAKLTTLVSAGYAQAMNKSLAKQVTEKKAEAENDTNYVTFRESLEQCEAKISWLKTYMEVFNNAHITYRQFAKE